MAQQGNPGTPPAAGASGEQGSQGNEGNQGGGAPGGKRLIAGKYESMEEAVENGIIGMENAFHKTREDLAKVTRILEAVVGGPSGNPGAPPSMDPRGGYAPVGTGARPQYDAYGRGYNPDPDYVDPTQFITSPGQVLRQREDRLLGRVAKVVEDVVANSVIVSEWKRQNPDLIPHERVVRAFMNETDQSKPYGDRLVDAAGLTRQYLTTIRAANGGNNNQPPGGANFVEGPRGGGGDGGGGPVVPGQMLQPQIAEEEKELMDYISERNADINARFGLKMK